MTESTSPSLDELIDRITSCSYGMPVRAMERVRAMGEAAIPALAESLRRWQDDEERDLLWLIVLLGEIRSPSAITALVEQMRRADLEILAVAAAEGLAKIGAAAVPALIEVTKTGDALPRLYAYVALGWIRDDRSYEALVNALDRDRELADVVAMALGQQGRSEAMPALYRAYRECEPWQRPEFEDALQQLHRGERSAPLWTSNWRLRYRRLPELEDGIDLEWTGISAIVRRDEERLPERPTRPLRPLEEILADAQQPEDPPETCEECGAPIERYTGLNACPETAVGVAVYQLDLLKGAREDGIEELFELLDELEADESERLDAGEPRTPRARARWRAELDELDACRETCHWLIEQGVEEVGPARALLLAAAARLADRYGDPEGLLRPAHPARDAGPKVGRNDPCPCGSGRKYKRCCLGKA